MPPSARSRSKSDTPSLRNRAGRRNVIGTSTVRPARHSAIAVAEASPLTLSRTFPRWRASRRALHRRERQRRGSRSRRPSAASRVSGRVSGSARARPRAPASSARSRRLFVEQAAQRRLERGVARVRGIERSARGEPGDERPWSPATPPEQIRNGRDGPTHLRHGEQQRRRGQRQPAPARRPRATAPAGVRLRPRRGRVQGHRRDVSPKGGLAECEVQPGDAQIAQELRTAEGAAAQVSPHDIRQSLDVAETPHA